MKGLTVIIPVKPPEPYLLDLKKTVNYFLKDIPHEIHVQTETGLTNAIIAGVQKSKYSHIAVLDADGSHNPATLITMIDKFNQDPTLDLIIGAKNHPLSFDASPYYRRLISTIYRKLTCFILNLKVQDPMSGYIMGTKKLFSTIKPITDYKFLLQLLTHNPPPKVLEIPIYFAPRQRGKSKSTFKTGLKALHTIIKLWWKKVK